MRNALAIIAGLISIASALPYIIDIHRGKTHPNVVSWLTWTLLNVISAAAAFHTGAIQTAIFSGCASITTGTIMIMGFRHGVKKYTPFDFICQVVALIGIVLWRLTNSPSIAVAIALVVDITGGLPTLRHAWIAPFAETWQSFALGGVASALTIISIANYTFISLAFPVWIGLNCALMVAIILGRRRSHPELTNVTG